MKRFLSGLLCLVMLISLAVPATASSLMPGYQKTKGSSYTDSDSKNQLTLPSGWKSKTIKDDLVAKAEFTNSKDTTATVTYGSADVWDSLSAKEQKSTPRAKYNNSVYSLSDIAHLVGTQEQYVKKVDVEGVEYFRAEIRPSVFKVSHIYYVLIRQGWMYVYAFSAPQSNSLYQDFVSIVSSAAYASAAKEPEETKPAAPSKQELYDQAVAYYNEKAYGAAHEAFGSLTGYKDTDKYLRLLNIRWYGGNANIGTGYMEEYALTDQQKREIDKAAKDFYFADTAEVLLYNSDVACYYLLGEWYTAKGTQPYAYFKMHESAAGGYYYTRSTNLSKATSSTVSINDGDVRISVTSSNKLVFHIELVSADCMLIHSYETKKDFFLYRK